MDLLDGWTLQFLRPCSPDAGTWEHRRRTTLRGPSSKHRAPLNLNSEVWILVVVVVLVLDQSTFSAAMRVRWLRNYFVQLV